MAETEHVLPSTAPVAKELLAEPDDGTVLARAPSALRFGAALVRNPVGFGVAVLSVGCQASVV